MTTLKREDFATVAEYVAAQSALLPTTKKTQKKRQLTKRLPPTKTFFETAFRAIRLGIESKNTYAESHKGTHFDLQIYHNNAPKLFRNVERFYGLVTFTSCWWVYPTFYELNGYSLIQTLEDLLKKHVVTQSPEFDVSLMRHRRQRTMPKEHIPLLYEGQRGPLIEEYFLLKVADGREFGHVSEKAFGEAYRLIRKVRSPKERELCSLIEARKLTTLSDVVKWHRMNIDTRRQDIQIKNALKRWGVHDLLDN